MLKFSGNRLDLKKIWILCEKSFKMNCRSCSMHEHFGFYWGFTPKYGKISIFLLIRHHKNWINFLAVILQIKKCIIIYDQNISICKCYFVNVSELCGMRFAIFQSFFILFKVQKLILKLSVSALFIFLQISLFIVVFIFGSGRLKLKNKHSEIIFFKISMKNLCFTRFWPRV